ncbi:MAG: permease [Candidatus Cryosericum sp.]
MLTRLIDWFTYVLLSMPQGTLLSGAVHFFTYDIIKIYALLVITSFFIFLVGTWLPPEKVKRVLANRNVAVSHFMAAVLGAIDPFCSCSAIPMFIGFVESGVPLGVTLSFLVASPLISIQGVVLLWSMFGAKVTLLYVGVGMALAIISGSIIGRLHLEHLVEDYVYKIKVGKAAILPDMTLRDRIRSSWTSSMQIFRKVAPWVAVSIAIGAFIHGYAPEEFMAKYAGSNNPFAVLVAVIVGIPLYASTEGIIPVVQALFAKGLPLGTTLAFMMAVTGLSLPEIVVLRRVLKPRLLITFVGIVGAGIIVMGYLFNWIF